MVCVYVMCVCGVVCVDHVCARCDVVCVFAMYVMCHGHVYAANVCCLCAVA